MAGVAFEFVGGQHCQVIPLPDSLNRGAVVADQADVLNWLDVNDRSPIPSVIVPGFVMRSVLSATLMVAAAVFAVSGVSAQAQMTPPADGSAAPPAPPATDLSKPPSFN
jgi:hypothetical protein